MMKAKYIYIASLAALMLAGCKDDEIINRPDVSGNEVQFGASLDPVTRTEYGEREGNAYPIYWNHGSNLDKIFIFSPDGRPGFQQGYYEVQPNDAGQTSATTVVRTSETGVQWGSGETSDFYAFYPGKESFGLQVNGSTLTATLPGEQMVTFAADAFPSDPTAQDITIFGTPDMNNCMMYAQTPNVPAGADNKISLQFKPLSSVLDITINGTDDETNFYVPEDPTLPGRTWAQVTSIEVESKNHQISGTFSYDFANNTYTANSAQAKDKVIRVDTRVQKKDANGKDILEGITLYKNQRLNVKIFLLPTADLNDLTITVHTADNRVWIKDLTPTMGQWKTSQINPVVLPKLNLKNKKFDYSVWMSQLDPNIMASELSLPGSCMSFVSNASGLSDGQKVQTLNYEEQYNQGIRVFQCHAYLKSGEPGADGSDGKIMIRVGVTDTGVGFFDVIKNLCRFMADNHSNEYCVVVVSDYINSGEPSLSSFYARLKELSQWPEIAPLLADNVTSKTTLGELAGKVILKIQLKGVTQPNIQPVNMQEALSWINAWDQLEGSNALLSQWVGGARSRVVYARSAYGTVGGGSYVNFRNLNDGYTQNSSVKPSDNPNYYLSNASGIKGAALRNILVNTNWDGPTRVYDYYWPTGVRSGLSTIYAVGTSSLIEKPDDNTLASDFWYIFVEHDEASYMTSMVSQLCNAINNTYKGYNNKRYMNYVGGTAGSAADLTTVSNTLYENWWNTIANSIEVNGTTLMKKPWGWVLFNLVGETMGRMINIEDNSIAASAGSTGTWITPVQRVIMHNNDFIMTRGQTTSKVAPQGDSKLTPSAVSLF